MRAEPFKTHADKPVCPVRKEHRRSSLISHCTDVVRGTSPDECNWVPPLVAPKAGDQHRPSAPNTKPRHLPGLFLIQPFHTHRYK